MTGRERVKISDLGRKGGNVVTLAQEDLMKLPGVLGEPGAEPPMGSLILKDSVKQKYEWNLDGYVGLGFPKPKTPEEEEALVQRFSDGLSKLLSRDNNWTFLQPLMLTLDYCARCNLCSEECPIYTSSGRKEIYRPTFRAEVLRRAYKREHTTAGRLFGGVVAGDLELNAETVTRLGELSYRCTLCRRCALVCPLGLDNGLIAREIRKLYSQEMGVAPKELHEKGTAQHLRVGSSTGLTPEAFKNLVKFMEDEIVEILGRRIEMPIDKKNADIMLFHNPGEFISWPENPMAFAILFDAAGVDWTLSSELFGFDSVNYGLFYDDVQFARLVMRQAKAARDLDVNRIVVGECGHAHKGLIVTADRILSGDLRVPRESFLPLVWEIVKSGKVNLDPEKNRFPVTLHDPCNIVRNLGIVEPQRKILKAVAPLFREMTPHGIRNYCCGGGSGFAIMQTGNFAEWRVKVASRMKLKQAIEAFQDDPSPKTPKYVCVPCSNCKGAMRDICSYYKATEKIGLNYGGLVDLVVNAMVDVKKPTVHLASA